MVRNVKFAAVITTKTAELTEIRSKSLCLSTRVEHHHSLPQPHQQTLFCSDPELTEII